MPQSDVGNSYRFHLNMKYFLILPRVGFFLIMGSKIKLIYRV